MRDCSSVVNGLKFYTPDVVNGEAKTAYELAEALGTAMTLSHVEDVQAGVYLLTPNGERAIEDIRAAENPAELLDSPDAPRYQPEALRHTNSIGNPE